MPLSKLKIHFIGIGGIGVSALARYYLAKGARVTGSDLVSSEITRDFKKRGGGVLIGRHKGDNIPKNIEMVVYSPAVEKNNPEYKAALKTGAAVLSYPEALGRLTKEHFTIAVSGTHGKSTTSSMLGLLLTRAGLDPTVIVGTKIKEFGNSNCRVGKSRYLVIEADEHFASFLRYRPDIIVLTNIEKDHLDYYKNIGNILKTFKKYLSNLKKGGIVVANKDDGNIKKVLAQANVRFFSLAQPEAKKLKRILKVPGEHNVYNALAALSAARILNVPDQVSFESLSSFKGSWRRFDVSEVKSKGMKFTLVSDYAHHPTEVEAAMKAVREKWPGRKIWCVFQPHQYQRTFYLFDDFVKAFRTAPLDRVVITDIYDVAGREDKKIKKMVNSEKLVKRIGIPKVIYLPRKGIMDFLKENLPKKGVLVVMGAGDIYELARLFHKKTG
jgi:UDP-N-acetylmuramate--alanine ligase